jgi:tRNA 2-thiouridine synthesizing protein A
MDEALLDARGLICPLPILKARKALKKVPVGATLRVLATDPGADEDFAAFCRTTGHELVESKTEGGAFSLLIKRSA